MTVALTAAIAVAIAVTTAINYLRLDELRYILMFKWRAENCENIAHSNGLSLLVVCDLHSHPPLQQRRLHLSYVPCKPSGHDTPSFISLSMRYSLSQL